LRGAWGGRALVSRRPLFFPERWQAWVPD